MNTTLTIEVMHTTAAASNSAVSVARSSETNNHSPIPRGMPTSVPTDELYYWSETWQAGEAETIDALARGEGQTFKTAKEAIRYLLSNDD